ncbi:hypothetical protein BKA69DRAFT_56885 [Paraphysoderma sedebokerense]|nr:hypothetical protein BKA69DRAFT_56885 [Paraphysoderma sedebokerense]
MGEGKTKGEKKRRCCCCIPLRTGVYIILSIHFLVCLASVIATFGYLSRPPGNPLNVQTKNIDLIEQFLPVLQATAATGAIELLFVFFGIIGTVKKVVPAFTFYIVGSILYLLYALACVALIAYVYVAIITAVPGAVSVLTPYFMMFLGPFLLLSLIQGYFIYVFFRFRRVLKKKSEYSA